MNYNSIRFDRNIALFGDEGQQRLHDKSVTIAGLGGVGCWVAPQVAPRRSQNLTHFCLPERTLVLRSSA